MAGKTIVREILDWTLHILIAVVIAFLIVTFVAQRTIVHDVSMQPTLYEGDNLIVEKISPKIGKLKRGDIIVFYEPQGERQLIKRVIAVEGDTVDIKDGKVFVNGDVLEEGYIKGDFTPPGEYANLTVGEDELFVLGDNRMNSRDSRNLGTIDISQVTGKAIFRFYPFNKIGVLKK